LLLFVLFLLTLPLLNPWVRGDGVGYYAYVRAPLIEHSLDFTHDYQSANESFREGRLDENGQPKAKFRTRTGHLDNHFTVGPAILWSPLLLAAHGGVLIARELTNVRADGFSAPYRYAMALGTGIYGFLALLLSFRLSSKYVGSLWSFIATIAVWGGSSLPVYMYFNPSWSHAHSAFIVALFLWYWDATRVGGRSLTQWLLLGIIVGLMLDVYYPNLMLTSILCVEALQQYAKILGATQFPSRSLLQLISHQVLFGVVVCVVMIPTFASRWIVYGGPFETGYYSIRDFLWNSPVFLSVLFSSNHGLLAWTPLLGFAIIGLLLFAFRFPDAGVPFVAAMLTFYLLISIYPDWAGISSYGNRFFISLTLLFIIGLAYLLERGARLFRQERTALAVSTTLLACFVLWNLGLIYQWGTHLIPARGSISFKEATYNQFYIVPSRLNDHLRSYFFRRSDLMQQIEKGDIEQQQESTQP